MAIFLAPGSIMALWGGGIDTIADLTYWVSIALTITCIAFHFVTKFIYKHHDCYCDEDDIKSTTLHAIIDVAMVVTYVFIGLVVANYVIDVLVGAETFDAWMTSSTYIVILLAALIGVMPGCGGMIAVAVAFITIPNFPIGSIDCSCNSNKRRWNLPFTSRKQKRWIDCFSSRISSCFSCRLYRFISRILNNAGAFYIHP